MLEAIFSLLKGKSIAQAVLDVGFAALSSKLTDYRQHNPDSFPASKQEDLEKYLLENWKEFLKLALYSGIDGLFVRLRSEASKTPSQIDDIQVQAVEFALRALIESAL